MTDIAITPGSVAAPVAAPVAETAAALAELHAALPGRVAAPGDPGWDRTRLGWVLNVDQHPAAVVAVETAADIALAVRIARRHGLSVSAQPVGHGATTALSGTVLLRTRGLREISIDTEARTARVGAGAKWGELLAALEPTGLAAPAGSSPDPSVVGYTLGGGLSWFGRAWGLAAHGVTAFEVVDADGRQRRVTADSDPDWFWALRGGGGDFGIVTALEMRLHPAPHVFGGRLMWPIEMARPVLRAFRRVTATAPEELTLWAHLFRFPPDPAMPEHLRGRAFVTVDVTFLGPELEANRLLTPLRQLPAMTMDSLGTVPLGSLGGIAAEPVDPMPGQDWSGLLSDLDDDALDRLVDVVGAGRDVPLAVVQLRHLGGALTRGRAEDGPSGAIAERYSLFALGVPVFPGAAEAIEGAFSAVRRALAPELTGRTAFNFLGAAADPSAAFTAEAMDRLRTVKEQVDPDGAFRSHRPVRDS